MRYEPIGKRDMAAETGLGVCARRACSASTKSL